MNAQHWNELVPPGTPVRYWPIMGEPEEFEDTMTRSEAWTLGHGQAVVKVEGRAGGVMIEHLMVDCRRRSK